MHKILLFFLLAFSSVSYGQIKKISPSGTTVIQEIQLSEAVRQISISRFNKVVVEYAASPKLRIEVDRQLAEGIQIETDKETLQLGLQDKRIWLLEGVVLHVTVYLPDLQQATLHAVNDASLSNRALARDFRLVVKSANNISLHDVDLQKFSLDAVASNNVSIRGTVQELNLDVVSSNLAINNLKANHVTVKAKSSLIKVHPTESMVIYRNEASTVDYVKGVEKINVIDRKGIVREIL